MKYKNNITFVDMDQKEADALTKIIETYQSFFQELVVGICQRYRVRNKEFDRETFDSAMTTIAIMVAQNPVKDNAEGFVDLFEWFIKNGVSNKAKAKKILRKTKEAISKTFKK